MLLTCLLLMLSLVIIFDDVSCSVSAVCLACSLHCGQVEITVAQFIINVVHCIVTVAQFIVTVAQLCECHSSVI